MPLRDVVLWLFCAAVVVMVVFVGIPVGLIAYIGHLRRQQRCEDDN